VQLSSEPLLSGAKRPIVSRRPLNIALVAPLAAPIGDPEPYGNHALLIDLATGLSRRGHRVRVYAAEGSRVPGVDLLQFTVDQGARGAPAGFERLFRRLRSDAPDVVSQHAFDAEAIELAERFPVLHTLHMPPIVPAVVRSCAHTAAPLAAVSEFSAQQWRAAGAQRVQAIRDGVPDFTPFARHVEPVALIAGRICREKGTAAGIRAALAAGLRVHLIGGVYDAGYFQREVAPLLGERVRMRACLPRRELWNVMAHCAVCLLPIEWDEPFGLVAAEAQVAGCPVVGYARGALPEIVEQDISGILVPSGDERGLIAAVGRAAALDRNRVRASARARLLIEPVLDRYEAELRSIAQRHRAHALLEVLRTPTAAA